MALPALLKNNLELPVVGSGLPIGDPTLEGLIVDAVASNLDLRAAAARVREARALRGITASRGKPQVAGNANPGARREVWREAVRKPQRDMTAVGVQKMQQPAAGIVVFVEDVEHSAFGNKSKKPIRR